jgi:hypothetical protein
MQAKLADVAKNAFAMPLKPCLSVLVDKQIPEQRKLGITEQELIKNVVLKETVEGEFNTVEDLAEVAPFFSLQLERASRPIAHLSQAGS